MTLRNLEIFLSVATTLNMHTTSSMLNLSQPSISQAIKELENKYDILLFERLNKKLYLTNAGINLLSHAQEILQHKTDAERMLKELSSKKTINFGATITVGKSLAPKIVKTFEDKNSNIFLNVTVDNTEIIERLLLNSNLDIALVEGKIKSNDLKIIKLMQDDLKLVCHKDSKLASKKNLTAIDLNNVDFILREKGSGTRELLENSLALCNDDVKINAKWVCHGFDSIIEALKLNLGITVLSERIINELPFKSDLRVLEINELNLSRDFNIVYHSKKTFLPHINLFKDYLLSNQSLI